MTPYYDHGGIQIFHGDCLDVMAQLEPESVDADGGSLLTCSKHVMTS